jgi:putative hydrolase of the HAD superfamily
VVAVSVRSQIASVQPGQQDNRKSAISLVVFDLGRVLIRICDGFSHACEVAAVAVPGGVNELDEATSRRIDDLVAQIDTGKIDLTTFARELAPLRGLRPQDIIRIQNIYLRGPYPGAVELIDELNAARVATACLSNTSDSHWRMMTDPSDPNYLPLERLTHRFASHLIGVRKPDGAIYEHVERATGAVPDSILFFDDLEANIAAAARRGWRAHQVRIDADPIAQVRNHLREAGVLR